MCGHTQTLSHIYVYADDMYSVCINIYLYIHASIYHMDMYTSKTVCVYNIHISKINTGTHRHTHVVPHSVCAEGKSMYGDFLDAFLEAAVTCKSLCYA